MKTPLPPTADSKSPVAPAERVLAKQEVKIAGYAGPFPPPSILAECEKVLPGSAERMFQYSEREQAHRHEMDSIQFKTESKVRLANVGIDVAFRAFGAVFLIGTWIAACYFSFVRPDIRFATLFFSPTVVLALVGLVMGRKTK